MPEIVNALEPRIQILTGPSRLRRSFPIRESEIRIGRDAKNDIRLDDDMVSRDHGVIRPEKEGPLLIDLESSNGTYVNGFLFPTKILVHGDRIKIGSFRLVYLKGEIDADLEKRIQAFEIESTFTPRTVRDDAYAAAFTAILGAFLEMNASISTIRNSDEIVDRVLDVIFRVVPADRVAILLTGHDQTRFVSKTYRRVGSSCADAFPIDEDVAYQVLQGESVAPMFGLKPGAVKAKGSVFRPGELDGYEPIACYPMVALDARVGVIYLVLPTRDHHYYHDHRRLLRSIAGFAAVALEHARYVAWLEGENRRLHEVILTEHGIIGQSPKMQAVYTFINDAAPTDGNVLITGARGTGKELVAYAIHRNSLRNGKPYHPVNTGGFPEELLENMLFGHERGSFTGAITQQKGLFELADGGTVFLDEIGDMSLTMQTRLLRVLQEKEVQRIGGQHRIFVNVRIIAATNKDLKQLALEKKFREDLLDRLNILDVRLPSLAERREDIPLLVAYFLKKHESARTNRGLPPVAGLMPEVHTLFATYDWPGNVRELETTIERALSLGHSEYIRPKDLRPNIRGEMSDDGAVAETYEDRKAVFDRAVYEETLQKTNWDYDEAARLLDISKNHFYILCREHKIQRA